MACAGRVLERARARGRSRVHQAALLAPLEGRVLAASLQHTMLHGDQGCNRTQQSGPCHAHSALHRRCPGQVFDLRSMHAWWEVGRACGGTRSRFNGIGLRNMAQDGGSGHLEAGQGTGPGVDVDGKHAGRLEAVQVQRLGHQHAGVQGALLVMPVLPCSAEAQGCEPGAVQKGHCTIPPQTPSSKLKVQVGHCRVVALGEGCKAGAGAVGRRTWGPRAAKSWGQDPWGGSQARGQEARRHAGGGGRNAGILHALANRPGQQAEGEGGCHGPRAHKVMQPP